MGHREPQADDFVWLYRPKDEVYDEWLKAIDSLEQTSRSTSVDDHIAPENALNIGFRLFPIIDSVSFNLFGGNGRRYLEELGYSPQEADLIFLMFRNGQLHNTRTHSLAYEDGEVIWSMSSDSGSGNWRPHIEEFDKPFNYEWDGETETGHAYLRLSGLAAQVRKDLEQRKGSDERDEIPSIVGKRMKGDAPKD